MTHLMERLERAVPRGPRGRSFGEVMSAAFGRGVLVHFSIHDDNLLNDGCLMCGCLSWIAYCSRDCRRRYSDADDCFECVDCGSVHTRRDGFGADAWEQLEKARR
jgi:hypothetical protein